MTRSRPRDLPGFDPTVPNEARMADYYMGGKDNFAADREAAELALQLAPDLPMIVLEARKFLGRAVRFLAGTGIRQFVDVGCGLPTQGGVHEVLRPLAPDARVAYVDSDPVVVVHARALLDTGDPAVVLQADARDPDRLLADPELTGLIDFDRPVAFLLHSFLVLIPEDDLATHIVDRFRQTMAPGSHLLVSHAISDSRPDVTEKLARLYQDNDVVKGKPRNNVRTRAEVERFLDGLEVLPPGMVELPAWRPDKGEPTVDPASVWAIGGIGVKR
ncbi:SAM-dependent methyltransferase [Actinomadura scrupuli]|uniref:SAM-dependent methyltransferase n=1 Tax=Actinomadura scrupuli TaxID=559629 RepID=UPI003D95A9E3